MVILRSLTSRKFWGTVLLLFQISGPVLSTFSTSLSHLYVSVCAYLYVHLSLYVCVLLRIKLRATGVTQPGMFTFHRKQSGPGSQTASQSSASHWPQASVITLAFPELSKHFNWKDDRSRWAANQQKLRNCGRA